MIGMNVIIEHCYCCDFVALLAFLDVIHMSPRMAHFTLFLLGVFLKAIQAVILKEKMQDARY